MKMVDAALEAREAIGVVLTARGVGSGARIDKGLRLWAPEHCEESG